LQDVAGKTVIYSSHVLSDLGDFDVTVSKSPQPENKRPKTCQSTCPLLKENSSQPGLTIFVANKGGSNQPKCWEPWGR